MLTLCYMDTDLLIYRIKTEDFYANIVDDVEKRFDTSNYSGNRPCAGGMGTLLPLPIALNKKIIGLMKDELRSDIITELVALRSKLYSYRKLDGACDKKCKGIKKCIIKKTLSFEDYKNCLLNPITTGTIGNLYRSQLMFRSTKLRFIPSRLTKLP